MAAHRPEAATPPDSNFPVHNLSGYRPLPLHSKGSPMCIINIQRMTITALLRILMGKFPAICYMGLMEKQLDSHLSEINGSVPQPTLSLQMEI